MNKLETVNKALTEIREILGAECANIEELPELVSALYEKTARGGFTTSFVFSSNSNPTLPVGGKLNIITGLIEGLNGDGSQTIQSDFKSDIGMSFAIFDAEGVKKTDGSRPINLKGAVGESGKDGEDGPQGPVGPPGEIGEVVSYRTVFAYTGTVTEESPSKPAGGSWDLATNNVIPPTSVNGRTMWVLNVNEVESGLYIWMSQATFNQDGSIVENGETPVRITGKDGKNGVDGSSIEFIYRLLPNNDSYTKLSRYLTENKLYSPETDDDVIPPINDNLGIDSMWTDSPIGISEEMQIEVVCTRTKKDGKGSDGSNCAMGSKGGEDGMDGDGVEYIYLVTPPKLTPGDVLLRMPDLDLAAAQPEYQQDEFCFNAEFGYPGYDGTDEPADVGPGKPLEWVSVRKKQDGIGQKFSEPKLGATYTERGVSYLTSFVFARAAADNPPAIPEGGEYYDPYPNDRETGHDSVPPSVENLPVGISTRTFATGEGELTFDTDWSAPRLLSDSSSFQVEYSADPNVTGEKITKFTGDEEAGRAAQPFKWGDDSEITDPIGMITASCTNGVGSDWVLTRIKGEKGDTGEAGSSVAIKHKVKTLQELLTEGDSYINGGPFFSLNADILEGEGVYIEESGLLYIYSGGYYPGEDTDFNKYGTSVTVKGEPGDSAYLYVAYTDGTDETATLYFDTPKKYIGVKYANYVLSETERKSGSTYTWQQGKGEDGGGQEQIFLLTHKDSGYDPNGNHLPLPSESKPEKDFLPTHSYANNAYPSDKGSDSPLSPSEEYPYCWVATRKVGGEEYGNWIGYNNKCSLYSRHSYDGINALSVDLTNDLVVVPLEEGRVDPDFIQTATITTFVKVFTGDEEIPSENFSVDTNEYITVEGNKLTLKLEALKTAVKEIPITINVGNSKHSITWHILYTDVAYELIPSKNCLRRYTEGDRAGFLEDDEILVEIWKWSDNKGVAAQIPVFAYLTFTNGLGDRILSTSDSEISVENGIAKINLNDLKDVETFEVYIVQSDSSGQYMSDYQKLSFENIAIVADGQRGEKGDKGDQGDRGETGASTFKSTVFKRYIPTAEKPVPDKPGDDEGSYDDPVPSGWSDGIPSGDPSIPIFSTYRNFGKLGGKQDISWSKPQLMADTADFDVEYCTKEAYDNPPFGHPNENTDEWKNTPSADAIWMATSSMKNGSWTDWIISRVRGEKGEKGDPGDSMSDEEKNAIKKAITEAVSKEAKDNIDAVQTSLEADIDTAKKNLNDAIAAEKAAREKGIGDLQKSQEDLAEAAANYAIKTDVEEALSTLEDKYFENGLIKEGVLDKEDVYNLSKAALGINADVGPNDIAKDSVFAQYVVGIAGRYVELSADQITSGTISGVTVKSESGSGQLNNNGSADLGNGGIHVDAGGSVTFGSNVNLSGNEEGNNNVNGLIPDIPEGWTKEQIQGVIQTTKIDGKNIQTGTLSANQIEGVEKLIADEIKTLDITTDQLNTKPTETSNTGKITIKDNDVIIYDADSETPSIVLTGSTKSAYDKSSSANTHTITGHKFESSVDDSDAFYSGVTQKLFTTDDVLKTGDTYVFKNTGISGFFSGGNLIVEPDGSSEMEVSIEYIIYYGDKMYSPEEIDAFENGDEEIPTGYEYLSHFYGDTVSSSVDDDYVNGNTCYVNGNIDDLTIVAKSGYNIYGLLRVYDATMSVNDVINGSSYGNTSSINTITLNKVLNQSILGSDGAKYMSSGGNYISLNNSGVFEVICNNYGFKIDENGIHAKKPNGDGTNITNTLLS